MIQKMVTDIETQNKNVSFPQIEEYLTALVI